MQMYRTGVLRVRRIPDVVNQWETPTYKEWGKKTAWRLFNATTFALNGKIGED